MYEAYITSADYVMRFERLQEDFNEVLHRLGEEPIEIPRLNVTQGRDDDYRTLFSPRTRKIVESVFAPDLERFWYEF